MRRRRETREKEADTFLWEHVAQFEAHDEGRRKRRDNDAFTNVSRLHVVHPSKRIAAVIGDKSFAASKRSSVLVDLLVANRK